MQPGYVCCPFLPLPGDAHDLIQNITGHVKDDLMHRQAIQRMVKMRGGLDALGMDGALAMMLSMYADNRRMYLKDIPLTDS